MARRTGWSKLSAGYRKRLTGAGITRQTWEQGGDLRRARGKQTTSSSGAGVADATTRAVTGHGTEADRALLRTWRETVAPSWLPSRDLMADDTAAALASLGNPDRWASVYFTPSADGPWRMTVTYKNANQYPRSVEIPGTDDARDVLDLLYLDFYDEELDIDVGESL
jgi:hypothetical protein